MTEHTPGTGKFECDKNGLVVEHFADGSCSFDLFEADEWTGSFDDGMKYARLIAAAPGLLTAAKALTNYYEKSLNVGPGKHPNREALLWALLRAAIKATEG